MGGEMRAKAFETFGADTETGPEKLLFGIARNPLKRPDLDE
jgi:hypothetical protein